MSKEPNDRGPAPAPSARRGTGGHGCRVPCLSAQPVCERVPGTRYALDGWLGDFLRNITAQWLTVAPHANPGMLEMFRDRDRKPLPRPGALGRRVRGQVPDRRRAGAAAHRGLRTCARATSRGSWRELICPAGRGRLPRAVARGAANHAAGRRIRAARCTAPGTPGATTTSCSGCCSGTRTPATAAALAVRPAHRRPAVRRFLGRGDPRAGRTPAARR